MSQGYYISLPAPHIDVVAAVGAVGDAVDVGASVPAPHIDVVSCCCS